jgi:orotidine-5'-phosphate decarboxylase
MKPLIVALDVDTEKEALSLIRATKDHVDIYKVGPTLILRYGPDILKKIQRFRKKIFLDLKFHDIPNTMVRSITESAKVGVFSATVHISAGETALKSVSSLSKRPKVWGVTVLTSLQHQDLHDLGFTRSPLEQVEHFAALAKRSGLDGVVASVGETADLRRLMGTSFTIVTPGIRLATDSVGDQKRIATPSHARTAGATYIVVGRPIIESKDPEQTADEMMRDWKRNG